MLSPDLASPPVQPATIASASETDIVRLWFRVLQFRRRFKLLSGRSLRVVSGGNFTSSVGPDLSGVVVRIAGVKFSGQAEVHRRPGQWLAHGHEKNPLYNTVVLHLCLRRGRAGIKVRREDGRPVPCLILADLPGLPGDKTKKSLTGRRRRRCLRRKKQEVDGRVRGVLAKAGKAWLYHRAARLHKISRSRRLFQPLVESLGYTYNHDSFRGLARRIEPARFRRCCEEYNSIPVREGWLLGRGGWFREGFDRGVNRAVYRRRLLWRQLEGASLIQASSYWKRGKVRPHCYPVRRWVAFGQATAKVGKSWRRWFLERGAGPLVSGKFRSQLRSAVLELFELAPGTYWSHHYTFRDSRKSEVPAPVGPGWFDQVAVNVFLPFLYSYFLYNGDDRFRAVEKTLERYPPVLQNRRTREFFSGESQQRKKLSVLHQQGAIFLRKQYCLDCRGYGSRCPIMDRMD